MEPRRQILILKWEIQHERPKSLGFSLETPQSRGLLFSFFRRDSQDRSKSPSLNAGRKWIFDSWLPRVYEQPCVLCWPVGPLNLIISLLCSIFKGTDASVQFLNYSYQPRLLSFINFSIWQVFFYRMNNVLTLAPEFLVVSWTIKFLLCSLNVVWSWAG